MSFPALTVKTLPQPSAKDAVNERSRLITDPTPSRSTITSNSGQRNYVIPAPKLEVEKDKNGKGRKGADETPDEDGSEGSDGNFLAILFVVYVLVALMNRLFQKLMTIPMYNYPMYLNLMTTFTFVPMSFAYIIPMVKYGTAITPEQRAIPKYKFAIMGALDCISGAMAIFAVNYISSGSMIVLIQQSAIPISMLFSKVTLGATYSMAQYGGAAVVCAGIVIVLLPSMDGSAPAADNGHNQILWSVVMMLSCIPQAISSVYKEMALQGQDIDVVSIGQSCL